MSKKPKHEPIVTTAARLPHICPSCIAPDLLRLSLAGGRIALTCQQCAWTERYEVRG